MNAKGETTEQRQERSPERPDRRRFLTRVVAGSAAGVVAGAPGLVRGVEERPLREADFYKPHTLAG